MFDILLGCFSLIQNVANIIGKIIKIYMREAFHSNLTALQLLAGCYFYRYCFMFHLKLPKIK